MRTLISLVRLGLCGLVTTAGASLMLLVGVLTLFRTRRLQQEVLLPRIARLALWFGGWRVVEHGQRPAGRQIFVSNHTSALDVVVVAALALPDTRFFFSRFTQKILPVGCISWLCGTFFTAPQSERDARVRLFQRADAWLKASEGSVYLTPEGERVRTGSVGPFNKGAFHLATSTGLPLAPFVIEIPPASDPEGGLAYAPGTVDVTWLEPVPTAGWSLDELDANREAVRERFLAHRAPAPAAPAV